MFGYIWNLYWTVMLTRRNAPLIKENENTWAFGQVAAVVALVSSLYGIVSSFLSKFRQLNPTGTLTP
jgi:hypothetical protein